MIEKIEKKRVKRKGLFFTIDALIGSLILLAALLMTTQSYVSEQPSTLVSHLSQDFINILGEIQLHEVNNTFIQTLYDNGSITNWNNTVLQQMGQFWADDKLVLANQFLKNVTEGILDPTMGYQISVNNETLYTRNNSVQNSLITSKKIVSGIQKSKPIKGYVAKAKATSVDKTSTRKITFSPEGAGWDGTTTDRGFAYLTKYFELEPGMAINNATMFVSMHIEDDGPDYDVININNGTCIITKDNLNWAGEEGIFDIQDVSTCLATGMNNVVLSIWNNGYNAHLHPGMQITIDYNSTENVTYLSSERSERFYFDNVRSVEADNDGSGAWAMVPFHLPPGASNVSATLRLNLQEVNDLQDRYWNWGIKYRDAWDFRVYVNSDTAMYQQNPGDSTDINDCLFYSTACGNEYNWTGNFDITSDVVTGTNVVAVYVNNYGDTVGGDGETVIYSNQDTDAENSSYVEINYTVTPAIPYGVIELRQSQDFGGAPDPTKDTSFQFPSEAIAISSVYAFPVEQYSYIAEVFADTGFVPGKKIFESPSPRAVPSEVYIDETDLDVSELATNYVRIRESGSNDVRPESSVEYGYYVPASVSYGDVFATQAEANADAQARLQAVMGPMINVSGIIVSNQSMSDVPSMWGPAIIEVRVWN